MISVKNLVKRYGEGKPAVNDVSFTISKGEIVGLLGPNGAGKSTIMKIITGYLNPTEGEVLIDGKNTIEHSNEIKGMIGYLPEKSPLYQSMMVYEYLEFIAEVRGIAKENIAKAIDDMIRLVALEKVASRKINELSNGYKKRVGLASAMIHDPEILILDEPTAGLDPNQIIMFRKILRRLSEKKTIILSTHVLSEIEAMCEKVIIINNGEKVADNSLQELVSNYDKEYFVDFVLEGETLSKIEEEINKLQGAWKVEFEKKEGKNHFRFKALLSEGSDFESSLQRDNDMWKLVSSERKSANLEEIFLKLTSQEDENVQ